MGNWQLGAETEPLQLQLALAVAAMPSQCTAEKNYIFTTAASQCSGHTVHCGKKLQLYNSTLITALQNAALLPHAALWRLVWTECQLLVSAVDAQVAPDSLV